ncbi:MAG: glycoside hydrolase family 9 protein [Pyrinomonadaceae bacterium]
MLKNISRKLSLVVAACLCLLQASTTAPRAQVKEDAAALRINELEYLEMPGLDVMLAHDYYPESHQGGVGLIQNGLRVATNGDLRLEPTPGQWQPVPKVGKRVVDRARQEISVRMQYPDPEKNRRGFNPIVYPDLELGYTLRIRPDGKSFRIVVDLERPLPDEWVGRVGFNIELFPGLLFGKSFYMDERPGLFPRQVDGPGARDREGGYQVEPLAAGRRLTVAPDEERQTLVIERLQGGDLQLLDGRAEHTNGWFVVRSLVPKGATTKAVEWLVTPHALPGWKYQPVVQVSQVGYHPAQEKVAVVETDPSDERRPKAVLVRAREGGGFENVIEEAPAEWGRFLRYRYFRFDFTRVKRPGVYFVRYGDYQTEPFQISPDVYRRHVWQPTLEYFLPAQMCHMRVNDRYRVWHGACHLDDARMAPVNYNHIDGYAQGATTLTKYAGGESVPGLDRGAWHDAGDDDIRVESQAETIRGLALLYEAFKVDYDNTSIDQQSRVVEIGRPDGKPDVLQQIEHGALSIVGGYKSLGRLYRGIITPTLRQYTQLGDTANVTDNERFDPKRSDAKEPTLRRDADGAAVTDTRPHDPWGAPFGRGGGPDDRWVFTEVNPGRELQTAAGLAAASRALKNFNPGLAADCLRIATELWDGTKERDALQRVEPAVELLLATGEKRYSDFLKGATADIVRNFPRVGWMAGRAMLKLNDRRFANALTEAARAYRRQVDEQGKKTPYGVPYEPDIWGAGWGIQRFGVEQYFLHVVFPEVFDTDYMLRALNFILGCHPGPNTASFASGVGARSLTTAYGFNRADWSYIPGGVGSGTALIRPDYPELLTWPFLWQQTEYVLGGGTTDYLTLVLAAEHLTDR